MMDGDSDFGDQTGDFAKSSGEPVKSILARDVISARPAYRQTSYAFLGDEDISVDRYFSPEWHALEVEKAVQKKMTELAAAGLDSASLTRDSSALRREFSPPSEARAAENETASPNSGISGMSANRIRREYAIPINSCDSLKVSGGR